MPRELIRQIHRRDPAVALSIVEGPSVVDQSRHSLSLHHEGGCAAYPAAVREQVVAGHRAPLQEVLAPVVLQAGVSAYDIKAGEALESVRVSCRAVHLGDTRREARPGRRHTYDCKSAGIGRHRQRIGSNSASLACRNWRRDWLMYGEGRRMSVV